MIARKTGHTIRTESTDIRSSTVCAGSNPALASSVAQKQLTTYADTTSCAANGPRPHVLNDFNLTPQAGPSWAEARIKRTARVAGAVDPASAVRREIWDTR